MSPNSTLHRTPTAATLVPELYSPRAVGAGERQAVMRRTMSIDGKRCLIVFVAAVLIDAAAFAVVFIPRAAVDAEGWAFLERQRPSSSDGSMFFCHDCLNFAVFRRGIGGWDTVSANLLQLANLPAFYSAEAYFRSRQLRLGGTSKQNSDAATVVLVSVALGQCAALAVVASIRRRSKSASEFKFEPQH